MFETSALMPMKFRKCDLTWIAEIEIIIVGYCHVLVSRHGIWIGNWI
jgi:hypothetical protein